MASRTERGSGNSALLLKELCTKLTGLSDDSVLPVLKTSLGIVGSNFGSKMETNESQVAEKIKRTLVRKGREKDAAIFSDLHRKLQAQDLLKQRWAVLHLLMLLSDSANEPVTKFSVNGSALFGSRLPSNATSTPFNPALHRHPPPPGSVGEATTLHSVSNLTGSSGISSIRSDLNNSNPTVPHSYMPVTTFNSVELDRTGSSRTLGSRLASTLTRQEKSNPVLVPNRRNKPDSNILVHRSDNTSFELPEAELIKDLVYVFQGIEGKWIKFDTSKDGYRIDSKAGIPKAKRQLVSKLAECGWLYSKTKDYIQTRSVDKTFGLVGQSFCAALQQELTEYYRLIAVLEGQVKDTEIDILPNYTHQYKCGRLNSTGGSGKGY